MDGWRTELEGWWWDGGLQHVSGICVCDGAGSCTNSYHSSDGDGDGVVLVETSGAALRWLLVGRDLFVCTCDTHREHFEPLGNLNMGGGGGGHPGGAVYGLVAARLLLCGCGGEAVAV